MKREDGEERKIGESLESSFNGAFVTVNCCLWISGVILLVVSFYLAIFTPLCLQSEA
jgi:hypothetical protein